jgi:MoaA/NifB/PqqE/SkfB family radical SAM enzyme
MITAVADAIAEGVLPGRLWLYSNYHCNLACTYCLTDSAPGVPKRALTAAAMVRAVEQAAALGFTEVGVTGGEPFLAPGIVDTLARMAPILPTLVLTNGTLFGPAQLGRLGSLPSQRVSFQLSLDSPDPDVNDAARGPDNFAKVIDAVPRLVEQGFRVRIASTATVMEPDDLARLCELHRNLGIPDEDHVVRPIARRGRGVDIDEAVPVEQTDLPPELTVTADGTFWSPFGPTVRDGRVDTDLLLTRTTDPLSVPAEALARALAGRPHGADTTFTFR